jgi:alkanesulfonate monooxygenase
VSDLDTTPGRRKPLRFHWSLSQAGSKLRSSVSREEMPGLPDFQAQVELCRRAERNGIDSMLMAIGFTRPDPLLLALALGAETESIRFMVACRPGLLSPVAFVQQVNSASAVLPGRICLNVVMGHTPKELGYYGCFLPHDERFEQADEFLTVSRALWRGEGPVDFQGRHYRVEGGRVGTPFVSPGEASPEIFVGGNSSQAADLAVRHASCLWRFPEPPESLGPQIAPVLAGGTEVGLIVSLLARPTREEALRDAEALLAAAGDEARQVHQQLRGATDSVAFSSTYTRAGDGSAWLTRCLWTGAVPYLGPPAIALVGSTEEIVETILQYQAVGVSQFLFLGWLGPDEVTLFGREILPRLRREEESWPSGSIGG